MRRGAGTGRHAVVQQGGARAALVREQRGATAEACDGAGAVWAVMSAQWQIGCDCGSRSIGGTNYGGPPTMIEKETRKEIKTRMFSTDRTLRWQRPDAATQRPVNSREVQFL